MRIAKSVPLLSMLSLSSLLAIGCGSSSHDGDGNNSCSGTETRCDGNDYQQCEDGTFSTTETCAGSTICDPSVGCAECTPVGGTFCNGDIVVSCNSNGTVGGEVETCKVGECSNGSCGGTNSNCQAQGVELIYVVTLSNDLLSFDPTKLGTAQDPFTTIGKLNCPAKGAIGGGPATPFSMSVDRNAVAWVLYTSGEIFNVSTENASCTATGFAVGQQGFEFFGMGFVTDAVGSQSETLFIAGGSAATTRSQDLGKLDTAALTVSKIGQLPNHAFGPELTGTGDAKLYAYYPGASSYVAEVDKTSGSSMSMLPLAGLSRPPTAWAFAHYGGRVYIFITAGASRVLELNLSTGTEMTVIGNAAPVIVGAGVSTCAPIVID